MIFMIMFYANELALASLPREQRNQLVERHTAYRQQLAAHATVVDNRGLQPSHTSVTVRTVDGEAIVRSGPAADGAEALAGFYLVDCADQDAAVALAKMYPMPDGLGCIEVRPVMATWDYAPSTETAAPPAAVWRRYADLAGWPTWKHGVEAVTLDRPLAVGASGWLTPAGGQAVPFRIVSATRGVGYVSETDLVPGGTLRMEHALEELPDGGTRIVHRATVPRALLDAFGMEFGPVLYEGMRRSVAALAAAVESESPAAAGGVPSRTAS